MNNEFKTTFIPKRKLTQSKEVKGTTHSSGGNSFIMLIAILLFVTAVISSAGVYFYKMRISSAIKERLTSIQRAEKAFEPNVILDLKKLDIRLDSGSKLLRNHVALSDFFESLGESTLPSVSFTDFTFSSKDGAHVEMSGEATGYLPIAQQSDLFEKNQYIQNPIFSDFELNEETGNVNFSLTFDLNPELIRYGRVIKNKELDTAHIQEQNAFIREKRNTIQSGKNVDFNSLNNIQQ